MDFEIKMEKFDKINNEVIDGVKHVLDSAIACYIDRLNDDCNITPL